MADFAAPHVVDKAINHVSGTISGVAAIYNKKQYLEERAAALEEWGTRLKAIVEGKLTTIDNSKRKSA